MVVNLFSFFLIEDREVGLEDRGFTLIGGIKKVKWRTWKTAGRRGEVKMGVFELQN